MKIGYYVQGATDEAVVRGLARRWCPDAELAAPRFRGASRESFRRELRKSLMDLKSVQACDVLVVLTDTDANRWRDVKKRESAKIPGEYEHVTVFGEADRNMECWLAVDRGALAHELECRVEEIPGDDPADFVKRGFGLNNRDTRPQAKAHVSRYVTRASLRTWIERSESFEDFYGDARRLARRNGCPFPNELEDLTGRP